ncbi:MAG TPA: DUF1992 domain-containing protein [Rhodocyclaceae bacterium]|nr:DUF1992 domain-containing protein [Rhodocyclaceae bacterium]
MSSLFEILAEQRITDAIRRGDLDHLPGAGKPLEFDDDPFVSPEQRMVNRILKNAGFTPAEILLRKEITALRREIEALPPGEKRTALKRELALLLLKLSEKG